MLFQDPVGDLAQRARDEVGTFGRRFGRVAEVDEGSAAAGGLARDDIAGAIADHDARRKVDPVVARSLAQHSGQRLAAVAGVVARVETDPDIVDRECGTELVVHLRDGLALDATGADVGLVRYDDQPEARVRQPVAW